MDYFKGLMLNVLTEHCFNEYFVKYNFFDEPCFKASASKVLGVLIIAGSVLVKLPQIGKIHSSKSGEGINIFGVCLELFAISTNFGYSYLMKFPFSAWGESVFLAIQTAIIAALVLHYGGSSTKAAAFLATYVALLSVLLGGYTSVDVAWGLQATNVPLIIISKTIQCITNYKNQSTGQLSAITCFLLFGGSIIRILTSIHETGDFLIILTYCVATAANGAVFLQVLWYWNSDKTKNIKKKKKH